MAMGGEQGFVVCYSRDGEDLVFVDQVGSKLEVKYGKVELEMPAEAPEWAHQAFVYAQENWA